MAGHDEPGGCALPSGPEVIDPSFSSLSEDSASSSNGRLAPSVSEDDLSSSAASSPRQPLQQRRPGPPPPGRLERGPSLRQLATDPVDDMVLQPLSQLSFVSSIVSGYSSIPIFALIITITCNLLYTR